MNCSVAERSEVELERLCPFAEPNNCVHMGDVSVVPVFPVTGLWRRTVDANMCYPLSLTERFSTILRRKHWKRKLHDEFLQTLCCQSLEMFGTRRIHRESINNCWNRVWWTNHGSHVVGRVEFRNIVLRLGSSPFEIRGTPTL